MIRPSVSREVHRPWFVVFLQHGTSSTHGIFKIIVDDCIEDGFVGSGLKEIEGWGGASA